MEQPKKQPVQKEEYMHRDFQQSKKPFVPNKSLYVAGGLGVVILVILGIFVLIQSNSPKPPVVMSFDECVRASYPVMESYPRQCQTPDGKIFVEKIGKTGKAKDGCIVTGCSSQICSDTEVITTCEAVLGDECYKNATCERQQNGECGWTQTSQLTQCLQEQKGKQILIDTSTDSTSLTAGWQTYRNEEFGFEVRYPQTKSSPRFGLWKNEKSGIIKA